MSMDVLPAGSGPKSWQAMKRPLGSTPSEGPSDATFLSFGSGLETLTKYKMVKRSRKGKVQNEKIVDTKVKKKTKKRKSASAEEEPQMSVDDDSPSGEAPPAKKKKKKKTRQKRKPKALKNKELDPSADNVDEDSDAEGAATTANNKKTRQKRKPKQLKKKATQQQKANEDNVSETDDDDDDDDNASVPEEGADDDFDETSIREDMSAWQSLGLPWSLLRALHEQGFVRPTPIQQSVLPSAMRGRLDVLGAAETGSGKTLAFGLPMLNGILEDKETEEMEEELGENEEEDSNDDNIEDEDEEEDGEDGDEDEAPESGLIDDDEFEDIDNPEAESGCVRVVNDVKFDFDEDEEEIFLPPMEELWMPMVKADATAAATTAGGKRKKLRGLILTPTRELALQIKQHLEKAAKFTGIKIAAVVGGMAAQKQLRMLSYGPDIVVATPGRLWDLIQEGNPHLSQAENIKYFAIDETDRMVERGHFEELHNLLEMVNRDEEKKAKRQTFVFSATLSLVHEVPKHVLKKKNKKQLTPKEKLQEVMSQIGVKPRHKIFDLSRKVGTAETLTESRIHCSLEEKDIYLYYFALQHAGRTLVFCNSIDCVRRLVNLFGLINCSPLGLHAQMHQKQRLKNLERFSADPHGLLIATDVAARGLDIPDVEHVVHYQVPRTSESYVHRSGRTARACKEGLSVVFIDPNESIYYKKMCKTLNKDEDLPMFPVDHDIYNVVKQRIQVARQLDQLKLNFRKEEASVSWLKKAAEEAELELSESDDDDETRETPAKQKANLKLKIQAKQLELQQILALPLIGHGGSGRYPTKSGKLKLPEEIKSRSALQSLEDDATRTKELLRGAQQKKGKKKFKRKKSKNAAAASEGGKKK